MFECFVVTVMPGGAVAPSRTMWTVAHAFETRRWAAPGMTE